MKVKCLFNTGRNLSQKFLDEGWTKESKMQLNLNSENVVYGISYFKNDSCYFLICDKYLKPFWYPDEIFEISNNKLSSLWYFINCNEPLGMQVIWGYEELVNIDNHNDNLMEREDEALEIFYKRKKEMDMEFPDFSVKGKANTIDQNWLICPKCMDEWESNSIFGMVECPKCNTIMHNPRYKKN
jgi:hypothetical protein